ncbi:hypothetical protein OF83DRAFT_706754 [Amylostereum chailletii]|nr:hypothetical protein OF83DRAFT_706754 [Amylostereum chailletii]
MEDLPEGSHSASRVLDNDAPSTNGGDDPWNALARSRLALVSAPFETENPAIVDESRHKLDADILAIQRALSAFCQHRNSLAPISRIPVEILAFVFSFLAISEPPVLKRGVGQPGWMKVTEVSHRWRSAAFENPRLWTRIPAHALNARWIREMAARSKSVPLALSYESTTDMNDDKTRAVLEHMHQTRDLSISTPHHVPTDLQKAISARAPMLENLDVVLDTTTRVVSATLSVTVMFTPGGPTYGIPVNAFADHAPKLRRVCLRDCAMSWTPSAFKALTHLEITRPHSNRHNELAYSTLEMLQGLAQMPELEVLLVAYTFPPWNTRAPLHADVRVSLPKMAKFILQGEMRTCLAFVSRFTFPDTAYILLHLDEEGYSRNIPLTPLAPLRPVTYFTLHFPKTRSLQLTGFAPSGAGCQLAHFSILLTALSDNSAMDLLTGIVESMPPLSSAESFRVTGTVHTFRSSAQWHRLFFSAGSVTRAMVEGANAVSFVEALSPVPARGADERGCMLPRLAHLSLKNVPFSDKVHADLGGEPLYAFLPKCMRRRARKGCRLQELQTESRTFKDYSSLPMEDIVGALLLGEK